MLAHTSQLKRGKKHEYRLDTHFSANWFIVEMPPVLERKFYLGDRIFINRANPARVLLIEYKSDESATRTRNLFIETISVDSTTPPKPGWAITCQAHFLFYYLPLEKRKPVLLFRPEVFRHHLERWRQRYPERPTGRNQNEGYQTWGVTLPLEMARSYVAKIIYLEGGTDAKPTS